MQHGGNCMQSVCQALLGQPDVRITIAACDGAGKETHRDRSASPLSELSADVVVGLGGRRLLLPPLPEPLSLGSRTRSVAECALRGQGSTDTVGVTGCPARPDARNMTTSPRQFWTELGCCRSAWPVCVLYAQQL